MNLAGLARITQTMRFNIKEPQISNDYATSEFALKWLPRMFPSASFYAKMIKVVFMASKLAKNGRYTDEAWISSSHQIFRAVESTGAKISVQNLKPLLDISEPTVIIGNHMSTLETFLLPYLVCPSKKVTFVIKEALTTYPIFRHIMNSRNPIAVGRGNPKEDFVKVLREGENRLKDGYSVVVFPQTTRMQNFDKSKFNSIGIKLARKAKAPVVPLALKTDFWGNGKLVKDFGKIDPKKNVYFNFGKPIAVSGNGKAEHDQVILHIENCLSQWNLEEQGTNLTKHF